MTTVHKAISLLDGGINGRTYSADEIYDSVHGSPIFTTDDRIRAHVTLTSVRKSLRNTNKALQASWVYDAKTGKRSHKVYRIGSRWTNVSKTDSVNGRNTFGDGVDNVQAMWANVYQQLTAGMLHVYNNKSDEEVAAVYKEMRKMQRAFTTINKVLTTVTS